MRFKHKELFIGVFVGAVVFGGFSMLADNAYEVVKNPYKVTVNGTEKPIEGYNIDGNTYFKLRDIGEQVGFNVDFKEETIMIDTTSSEVSENQSGRWLSFNGSRDDVYVENGIKYHLWGYFEEFNILSNTYIDIKKNEQEEWEVYLKKKINGKKSDDVLLEHIPYKIVDDRLVISEDYFNSTILPLDK